MKNNKYSYIGIALVVLVFGIFTVKEISKKIQDKTVVDEDRHLIGQQEHVDFVTIGKAPEFRLTDQNGETVSNDTYKGKVYVLEFFFTTCPSICPIMNKNMMQLHDEFITKDDFGVASITINPENDTPEVLKEYATSYGVKNPNWHFLTGDRDEIFELANTGFNVYVGLGDESNGGFEHSGLFALIDKKGNIVSRKDDNGNPIIYYDGLSQDHIKMLKSDIAIQLKK